MNINVLVIYPALWGPLKFIKRCISNAETRIACVMAFMRVNFKTAVVALVKISDSTARDKIFVFAADELETTDLER